MDQVEKLQDKLEMPAPKAYTLTLLYFLLLLLSAIRYIKYGPHKNNRELTRIPTQRRILHLHCFPSFYSAL